MGKNTTYEAHHALSFLDFCYGVFLERQVLVNKYTQALFNINMLEHLTTKFIRVSMGQQLKFAERQNFTFFRMECEQSVLGPLLHPAEILLQFEGVI